MEQYRISDIGDIKAHIYAHLCIIITNVVGRGQHHPVGHWSNPPGNIFWYHSMKTTLEFSAKTREYSPEAANSDMNSGHISLCALFILASTTHLSQGLSNPTVDLYILLIIETLSELAPF